MMMKWAINIQGSNMLSQASKRLLHVTASSLHQCETFLLGTIVPM